MRGHHRGYALPAARHPAHQRRDCSRLPGVAGASELTEVPEQYCEESRRPPARAIPIGLRAAAVRAAELTLERTLPAAQCSPLLFVEQGTGQLEALAFARARIESFRAV